MPKRSNRELVNGRYFRWRIWKSYLDVWYADGRVNEVAAGRHSLGTKDKDQALKNLHRLDAKMAVEFKLADPSILDEMEEGSLTIADGAKHYLDYVSRPVLVGDAKKTTQIRYRTVFNKFEEFARSQGVTSWRRVTKRLLEAYAGWLDDERYAYRTAYLELTTLKQAMGWMASESLIPRHCLFKMTICKPNGSPTYCYSEPEVKAILNTCFKQSDLVWLGRVVAMLAYTGMRIGEVEQLTWDDIDLEARLIHVRDESRGAVVGGADAERSTKSGKSRHVPIHHGLRPILENISRIRKGKVFHGPRGGQLKADTVRNNLIRDVLTPLAASLYPHDAAPDFQRGRLHSFRHFFCTQCYRAGMQERQIIDLMGHSDSAITRLYRHFAKDEHRGAIDQLNMIGDFSGHKPTQEESGHDASPA